MLHAIVRERSHARLLMPLMIFSPDTCRAKLTCLFFLAICLLGSTSVDSSYTLALSTAALRIFTWIDRTAPCLPTTTQKFYRQDDAMTHDPCRRAAHLDVEDLRFQGSAKAYQLLNGMETVV